MEVQFRRSGAHRYAVTIVRPGQPVLEKDPAPGYDDKLPHDLIHLIVERELGLQLGIFGQVAAGGTAGMFYPTERKVRTKREASRQRRSLARRGGKLQQAGRGDSTVSEAVTYLARNAWESRHAAPTRRAMTATAGNARHPARLAASRRGPVTAEQLEHICDVLDIQSARWVNLPLGDSMTVVWPDKVPDLHHRRSGLPPGH